MRYVEFAGWRLSKVGLGTSQFANPSWGYGNDYAPQELVRQALALGITHFDTNDHYSAGRSQRILGATLRDVEGVLVGTGLVAVAPSTRLVMARARESTERLGRPLDLCYTTWPNPFFTDRSLMAGMRRLREEGLVAEIGVSGYNDLARWQMAERYLGAPVMICQVLYNLLRRDVEMALLPWAAAKGRLVVVAQPLATGLLSGAYHRGKRVTAPRRVGDPIYSSVYMERTAELVGTLGAVAKAHDATVAQVALAYVLHHPNVVAIPGAATASQLAENAAAADLELDEDEWRELAEAAGKCPSPGTSISRPGLGAAKHWARLVKYLAATMREDRRLKRTKEGHS
jgi:aryl-alcohol dehydrogenase-like predicted oxidoreductase